MVNTFTLQSALHLCYHVFAIHTLHDTIHKRWTDFDFFDFCGPLDAAGATKNEDLDSHTLSYDTIG